MSIPIVTGKVTEPFVMGGKVRRHTKIVAGCDDYTTGGDDLDAKDLGDTWILNIAPAVSISGDYIAYFILPDTALAKTVKMFVVLSVSGAEAALHADLSAEEFVVAVDSVG